MSAYVDAYHKTIKHQAFTVQAEQIRVAQLFDVYQQDIMTFQQQKSSSFWQKLWQKPSAPVKKGFYLYGDVGRGKSMMMDIFFHNIPLARKTRIHFHHFMKQVHEKLHLYRQDNIKDPIAQVAYEIAQANQLLCFDEMQILDITDAMIVGRLFKALYEYPMFFVMTSNRPPQDLYKNGLNRPLFEPFIDFLNTEFHIVSLNHQIDFRSQKIPLENIYLSPVTPKNRQKMDDIWNILTDYAVPHLLEIDHAQRKIHITKYAKGIIRGTFAQFCSQNYNSHDYLAMIQHCHAVILEDIPLLTPEMRNEATRFRNLIDVLYESKIKCYFLAETSMEHLYPVGDFAFEFERTVSRLREMQSQDYMNNV